jgi:type IV pilus assembly protein PilC
MPISTRSLIQFCHRVGMSVRSGIDARRVWEIEERHAMGPLKSAIANIRQSVASGGTVAEGMQDSNGYFPPMFVQMVAIGEQTGQLDEVLKRLGEHYQQLSQLQRSFWMGIAWPLFELVFAIFLLGLVMIITGAISATVGGEPLDILGIGLADTSGAIIWFLFWALIAAVIGGSAFALMRGYFGPGPVLAAMRIPVIGKCMESFALSRLTWSLALALECGMDARRSVELSIKAAQNPYYESSLPLVAAGIRANQQFHEAFARGGVFPRDFLEQLEVAEEAGATNETLFRLAKEYEDRARSAIRILTTVATVVITLSIALILAFAIISMAWHTLIKRKYEMLDMINSGKI